MLKPGTILAGYRLDGVLGEGGMGTVYRATQLSLNRVVALKLLAGELSDDAGFRTRFEREGQLQAGLDHENIVTVYEAGQTEHGLFLAMRLIDGPTLKQLIRDGNLGTRRVLRILAQVARALDEAHAAGLIHRDIKPQNILVDRYDHAYLADFGLIKAPDEAQLTGTGQFLGTIDYVAPEQIQGDPAAAASDCYALAAVLYECLTGQVPFPRANEAATLHAHIVTPPPRPTDVRSELPSAIDALIASGMSKDPAERPASPSALIRSAAGALTAGPAASPTPADSAPERPQSTRVPGTDSPPRAVAAGTSARAPADATKLAGSAAAEPTVTVPGAPASARATQPPGSAETRLSVPESPSSTAAGARTGVAVVLAVVAIVVGFLVGHAGNSSRASRLTNSAAAGHVQLRYPPSWHISSAAADLRGIGFGEGILLLAPGRTGGRLAAGLLANALGPTLLPPSFRDRLGGGLPRGRPVGLNGLESLSYTGLRVRGLAGTASVYAVATSGGAAVIVCSAPTKSPRFDSQCARVAATLRLLGTPSFGLGPSAAYARGVSTSLKRLRASAVGALATLRTASSPAGQASAARQLAQSYTASQADLRRLTVSSRDRTAHDRILGALGKLAAAYGTLAVAARRVDAAAYARAGRAVASADLGRALRGVVGLGYRLSAS